MNSPTLRHALAGLQAGMQGAIALLAWLMLGSLLNRRSMWQVPTLFGTTFYGSGAYTPGFGIATWSGIALIVFLYGGLGVIWGIAWGERFKTFLALYGAAFGLVLHYIFFRLVWPHANPAMALYAPSRQLLFAQIIWGMFLARSPRYARMAASVEMHEQKISWSD